MTRPRALLTALRWLPAWSWQQATRRYHRGPVHLLITVADHFEPTIVPESPRSYAPRDEQERRVERWCREYPRAVGRWRDVDRFPIRHTYFYPAEAENPRLVARLSEHCLAGWGEVEIHLHHGVDHPDTAEATRAALIGFRDTLESHGCLSRLDAEGASRYAFVHGNFSLANSAGGSCCGVDEEMQILADTGCYGDFTLPSAPNPAQVRKINALYECALPLANRAPHRRGRDLRVGRPPRTWPLVIQGPLGVTLHHPRRGWPVPGIESGALTGANPATLNRLRLWRRAGIAVKGRPDWLFLKLYCHGMDPRDEGALVGAPMQRFLEDLLVNGRAGTGYHVHFVTAREMVNIALAACDGKDGDPGAFRDYRLRPITPGRIP